MVSPLSNKGKGNKVEEKLPKSANGNLACVFLQVFSMITCPQISCLTYRVHLFMVLKCSVAHAALLA